VLNRETAPGSTRSIDSHIEEKKTDHHVSFPNNESGFVSFEDMLKTGRESPEVPSNDRAEPPSLQRKVPEPTKRAPAKSLPISDLGEFVAPDGQLPPSMDKKKDAVLIEVKPLPKIRLSLMPSPREEDEDENSSSASAAKAMKKKKKKSSSRSSSKRSTSKF
jgi:hypothetical protein